MAKKGMKRPETENKSSSSSMCKNSAYDCHEQNKTNSTHEHSKECCKHDSER